MAGDSHGTHVFPIFSLSEFLFSFATIVYREQTGSFFVHRSVDHEKPHLDLIKMTAQNLEMVGTGERSGFCG